MASHGTMAAVGGEEGGGGRRGEADLDEGGAGQLGRVQRVDAGHGQAAQRPADKVDILALNVLQRRPCAKPTRPMLSKAKRPSGVCWGIFLTEFSFAFSAVVIQTHCVVHTRVPLARLRFPSPRRAKGSDPKTKPKSRERDTCWQCTAGIITSGMSTYSLARQCACVRAVRGCCCPCAARAAKRNGGRRDRP